MGHREDVLRGMRVQGLHGLEDRLGPGHARGKVVPGVLDVRLRAAQGHMADVRAGVANVRP